MLTLESHKHQACQTKSIHRYIPRLSNPNQNSRNEQTLIIGGVFIKFSFTIQTSTPFQLLLGSIIQQAILIELTLIVDGVFIKIGLLIQCIISPCITKQIVFHNDSYHCSNFFPSFLSTCMNRNSSMRLCVLCVQGVCV